MPFLTKIDELHKKTRQQLSVPASNKKFCTYIPIEISNGKYRFSYMIRKEEKSKILAISGLQRVYLSDYHVLSTILSMDATDIEWFLEQFVSLYRGKGSPINLLLAGSEFSYTGIPAFPRPQELTLLSDTKIDYSYFCFLLNFIFAKDKCWEEISGIPGFGNITLCKYISILDYIHQKSVYSKVFLETIGYPTDLPQPADSIEAQKVFRKTDCLEKFDISNYI